MWVCRASLLWTIAHVLDTSKTLQLCALLQSYQTEYKLPQSKFVCMTGPSMQAWNKTAWHCNVISIPKTVVDSPPHNPTWVVYRYHTRHKDHTSQGPKHQNCCCDSAFNVWFPAYVLLGACVSCMTENSVVDTIHVKPGKSMASQWYRPSTLISCGCFLHSTDTWPRLMRSPYKSNIKNSKTTSNGRECHCLSKPRNLPFSSPGCAGTILPFTYICGWGVQVEQITQL